MTGPACLVLRDLLDAAVAEDLAGLAGAVPGDGPEGRGGSWARVALPGDGWLAWPARPGGAVAATRYADGPVLVGGPGQATRAVGPAEVVALLAPDAPYRDVVARDLATAVEHAAVTAGTGPTDTDGEVLAASRSRPFHPTARAVVGWSSADLERWGPGRDVPLDWVAVRRDRLRRGSGASSHALHELVGGAEDLAADPEYQPIPVHPFDHDHVLPVHFAREIDEGFVVPLARGVGAGRATASLRTLDLGGGVHLKLPLGVATLGSTRLLPPRHLANGERGERVLRRILAADPALAARVTVADEGTWVGFGRSDAADEFDDRPGRLAAQIRRLPARTGPPLAALAAPRAWASVADPDAVFAAVVDAVVEVGVGFLRHGAMPEMHGQNVLLDLDDGDVRLVLRDHDTVRVHPGGLTVPDPCYRIAPGAAQSLRLDTAAELIGFFQTLVVQVALHGMIDALARHAGTDEDRCWAVVRDAVVRAVDATASPATRATLHDTLLAAPDWPHRAVLGPLLERGPSPGPSMPAGVTRIRNPLSFPRRSARPAPLPPSLRSPGALPPSLRSPGALPPSLRSPGALPPSLRSPGAPMSRVLTQLVESLVYEDAVEVTGDGGPGTRAGPFALRFVRTPSFGRVRLTGPVTRSGAPVTATEFLADAPIRADDACRARFAVELEATEHADSLVSRSDGPLDPDAGHDVLEALADGHRYHPAYKSRTGFDDADQGAYAPEFAPVVRPVWVAVDHADVSAAAGLDPRDLWAAQGVAVPGGRVAIPVHPWQWEHRVSAAGVERLPGDGHDYRPQASIRTLACVDAPRRPSLKLSLSITNTSTSRELAPYTVRNAARVSDWLAGLVAGDTVLRDKARVILLREVLGTSAGPGLGAIWRESLHVHLHPAERAVPFPALTARSGAGAPLVDPWIRSQGARGWTQRLCVAAVLPLVHLLVVHGVALEAHAQNMLLVHAGGLPTRVALKDFHDGVRFSRSLLSVPAPVLEAPPASHGNANSFLETDDPALVTGFLLDGLGFVNLAEIAFLLATEYGFAEEEFWAVVRATIEAHAARLPAFAARLATFDVFAATLAVEGLTTRRLWPDTALRLHPAPNPLRRA